MARITRVEIFQVDLKPHVPRSDAIQTFSMQETPMLRIFCDDGSEGTGYSYTIGNGGSSVVALLRDHLAPRLLGKDPAMVEEIWKDLFFFTHATSVGAITSIALCVVDTALWDRRCRAAGLPLARDGGRCADAHPGLRHRRRLAASEARRSGRERAGGQVQRLPRGQDQDRPAACRRGCGAAGSGAQGARPRLRHHDGRQPGVHGVRGDPARPPLRGAGHLLVRGAAARRRSERSRAAVAIDLHCRSPSASRSIIRATSASTCSAAHAPSCRSMSGASAASRRG